MTLQVQIFIFLDYLVKLDAVECAEFMFET